MSLSRKVLLGVVILLLLGGIGVAIAGDRALLFRATFIGKGTGAAEISAMEKMRQVVGVKDYGALCNGAADDTQSLINSHAAAVANGASLLINCKMRIASVAGTLTASLKFEGSGALDLSPAGGATTIASAIIGDPLSQIFFTGSGSLTLLGPLPFLVPQWFGAKGNNSNDDSAAINATIAAIKNTTSGSGRIWFPPGTYLANNIVWSAGVEMEGDGPNATVLKSTSANPLIKLINGAVGEHHGHIARMTLEGNSVGTIGIQLTLVSRFLIKDVTIQNFVTAGMSLSGTLVFEADQLTVSNSGTGILATSNSAVAANHVRFVHSRINNNATYGVDWTNGAVVDFDHCEFGSNGTGGNAATGGVKFTSMSLAGEAVGAIIRGGWFENNNGHSAIRINAPNSAPATTMIQDTTIFGGTRTYGVWVTSANNRVDMYDVVSQNAGTADFFIDTNVVAFLDHTIGGTHTFNGYVTALPTPDSLLNHVWNVADPGTYTWQISGTPFLTITDTNIAAAGSFSSGGATLTYSATIATDAALGNSFTITATNGTAFTISNPSNAATRKRIRYIIRNGSGGALGAITWGALFKVNATAIAPANTTSRTIEFEYDGTNWVEQWRGAFDVPN